VKNRPSFFRLLEKHEMKADFRSGGSRKPHSWEERMREYGSVSIAHEVFIAALRMGEE
jgi:hypothetical protein